MLLSEYGLASLGMNHLRLIGHRFSSCFLCFGLAGQVATQTCAAQSQTPRPVAPSLPPVARPAFVTIPKGTKVCLKLMQTVSSATAQNGQNVQMTVANDIVIDGLVVLAKGSAATGILRHVKKAVPRKREGNVELNSAVVQITKRKKLKLGENSWSVCGRSLRCWVEAPILAPFAWVVAWAMTYDPDDRPSRTDVVIAPSFELDLFTRGEVRIRTSELLR